MLRRSITALLCPFLLLAACSSGVRVPSSPEPGTGDGTFVLPAREIATIALPVTIPLASLREALNRALPPADSLDRARCSAVGGLVCHQYVYRRDSLALAMEGDRIGVFASLRYRGRVAAPGVGGLGSCGYAPDPMRRAELRMATTLFWRVDWKLATRNTAVDAALLDPCRVTVLDLDATPVMKRMVDAQLASVRRQIDSAVPALSDVRRAADSLWRSMQEPVAMDSTGAAWLVMAPERVSVAPLTGVAGLLSTGIVITARPRVVLGARPATVVRPLPALTLARPSGGLHVPVDVELPFDELGRRAAATLAVEAAGSGIAVDSVRVWSRGDTAVIRVDVRGKLDGALFLVGRFAYDSTTRSVVIGDLRYTLESRTAMSRVKATLGAVSIRHAIEEATGRGKLNVGQQLDAIRSQLTLGLNRELGNGVVLGGMVRDVRVEGLYTTPTAFVVRAVLEGDARLTMR